jgi:hypothetical protein
MTMPYICREWRAMLDDAVHASAKWTSYNRDRCDALAAATEDAVEKMLEKVGFILCPILMHSISLPFYSKSYRHHR